MDVETIISCIKRMFVEEYDHFNILKNEQGMMLKASLYNKLTSVWQNKY